MADGLLEVAADADQTSPAGVNKARLLSDNTKWLLSKALPKVYGDKLGAKIEGKLPLEGGENRGPCWRAGRP